MCDQGRSQGRDVALEMNRPYLAHQAAAAASPVPLTLSPRKFTNFGCRATLTSRAMSLSGEAPGEGGLSTFVLLCHVVGSESGLPLARPQEEWPIALL